LQDKEGTAVQFVYVTQMRGRIDKRLVTIKSLSFYRNPPIYILQLSLSDFRVQYKTSASVAN
jgi:hypothetical protein